MWETLQQNGGDEGERVMFRVLIPMYCSMSILDPLHSGSRQEGNLFFLLNFPNALSDLSEDVENSVDPHGRNIDFMLQ